MPKLSINLNPHKAEESFKIKTKKAPKKQPRYDQLDVLPDSVNGLVRIDHPNAEIGPIHQKTLRQLEHFRPGITSNNYSSTHFGKVVLANNIGCILRHGQAHFLKPSGRYRLPLGCHWVLDPELENPFLRPRTDCGDVSILNLDGNQIAIIQDGQRARWALSYGLWLVLPPCSMLSFVSDVNSLQEKHAVPASSRQSYRFTLASDTSENVGTLLLVAPNHLALVQHKDDIITLPEGRRVLLDQRMAFISFVSLAVQQLNLRSLRCSTADHQPVRLDVFISWRCLEPRLFLKTSSSLDAIVLIKATTLALLGQYYAQVYTDKLVVKKASSGQRTYDQLLEDLRYTTSVHLGRTLSTFGLELLSLVIARCSIKKHA